MTSSFLPDSDYSEYLVDQYQDMITICGANLTNFTIRALPYYEYAPNTYDGYPMNANDTT